LNQPLVDGSIKLYRDPVTHNPKYLIFGLRRGGRSFWAIDVSNQNPANWTVAWSFSDSDDPEMGESWSDVEISRIRTASNTFKDVAIFSGGYDPYEDNFPEPFNDLDHNGTPFKADGTTLDTQEWDKNNASQDVYPDDKYTLQNPNKNSQGRAIYVVGVSTGDIVFTVKYGAANNPALGSSSNAAIHTRTDFKYCFPASPSVVSQSLRYGPNLTKRMSNVLAAIYAPDIYGNLFRITYDYEGGKEWQVQKLFSANPDSSSASGFMGGGLTSADTGRKVFYAPAVSWGGVGSYFDASNYHFDNTTFSGTNAIATLYFGTGDREHPSYKMIKDRVYAVYDDLPVKATRVSDIPVGSAPYTEANLLNITCDELGVNTVKKGRNKYETAIKRIGLQTLLTDDVVNPVNLSDMELSGGGGEDDAKGWYIILEKQGLPTYCTDCDYAGKVYTNVGERDYHFGEKILSKLTLFNKVLYFNSYQPAFDDPCSPQGNAFLYALGYLNGNAAQNRNVANDSVGPDGEVIVNRDVTDRYGKIGVKVLPSEIQIIKQKGFSNLPPVPIEKIDSGIDLYYWVDR
jgi:type IV pilus assembly protein PilY1